MSARDDYPRLAGYATPGYINEVPHQSDTGKEFAAALDEIDRLAAVVAAVHTALDQFYEEWPVEHSPTFVSAIAEAVGR